MSGKADILHKPLRELDPELSQLLLDEEQRQRCGLEMISSENCTSHAVLECLSSCVHNKYGNPHDAGRMSGCNYFVGEYVTDEIELFAQKRALEAFELDVDTWGVNVQPYSGPLSNFAVYTGLLQPHDRIMGLDMADGGHLMHGFMTTGKRISDTSIFFESMPYKVDAETGLIDYDELHRNAKLFKPKIIFAHISCYSRQLDYQRFREICNNLGSYLFVNMTYVAGMIAAGHLKSSFVYADVVTTTTHKTLRGPRAGVIFFRKGLRSTKANGEKIMYNLEDRINKAVFPGLQGCSHVHQIAGIATAFLQAKTPEFRDYQKQIIVNAQVLANSLENRGYKIVNAGTGIHLVLIDLRTMNLNGACAEYVLEKVNITCNSSTVPGDESALNPSGIRLGTAALTSRGLCEDDIERVVDFIDHALKISIKVNAETPSPKFIDFQETVHKNVKILQSIDKLREKVEKFSEQFPLPGMTEY